MLMKLTEPDPSSTSPDAPDPFNYALAQQLGNPGLNNPAREPSELKRRMLAAFPALLPVEAESVLKRLDPLYTLARYLASGVNQRALTEDEGHKRLAHAFPQANSENLSKLLVQSLVGTR